MLAFDEHHLAVIRNETFKSHQQSEGDTKILHNYLSSLQPYKRLNEKTSKIGDTCRRAAMVPHECQRIGARSGKASLFCDSNIPTLENWTQTNLTIVLR